MRFSGDRRTTDRDLPRPAGHISTAALAMVIVLAFTLVGPAFGARPELALCPANANWVTNPDPPQEIPGGGTDLCQFYQFAWQWFLYLVSPSSSAAGADRNFEVQANFPLLQAKATTSCTATSNDPVLFVRTLKSADPNGPFTVPTDTGQAGTASAVIYDKAGNTVFYQVRFSRNLCPKPATPGNLPVGTTEVKTAWRVLDASEVQGYYTNETIIEGFSSKPVVLGLIGFHLFRTTAEHPEGVWMTWEHKSNVSDCLPAGESSPPSGWSFTSQSCFGCLTQVQSLNGPPQCARQCNFNSATVSASLTGIPSQICRVYHDATDPTDASTRENIKVVDTLNSQLNGLTGILTELPADSPMAVFANYEQIGGIWLSNPQKPSKDTSYQRGSLQLANSVMETTFQGVFDAKSTTPTVEGNSVVNCFGCHIYTPNETVTSGLSHIIEHLHPSLSQDSSSSGGGAAIASVPSHQPSAGGEQ